MTGRFLIQKTEREVNKYLQSVLGTDKDYCVAIDTDSNYYTLDDLVQKVGLSDKDKIIEFINKVCETKIQGVLNSTFENASRVMNSHKQAIKMNREVIAEAAVWTGKKHYIMLQNDKEGTRYDPPKLKVVGMEAKKSSTPQIARDGMNAMYREILTTQDADHCRAKLRSYRDEFHSLPPEKIAFPRGISDVDKYVDAAKLYRSGTPIHARAAILYNMLREKHGLDRIKPLTSGDKLKYVYLTLPNPIQENVIGFIDGLPESFGLHEFIDRDLQFQKSFKGPIEDIFEAIGWGAKDIQTLDELFEEE